MAENTHKLKEIVKEPFTLKMKSKNELIQLAKEMSGGCFEKKSAQREQILQMIVNELADLPGAENDSSSSASNN